VVYMSGLPAIREIDLTDLHDHLHLLASRGLSWDDSPLIQCPLNSSPQEHSSYSQGLCEQRGCGLEFRLSATDLECSESPKTLTCSDVCT